MERIDFRILGPLEAHDVNGPVALGGARQRALLAVLLLHPNEVVSTDHLTAALWGDRPPEGAGKALQVNVSRLRKLLVGARSEGEGDGGQLLVTRPPGYLIRVEPDQLDLTRFEGLCAEARDLLAAGKPGEARDRLGEALSLWRGEPLADVAYESFAQPEITRVEGLRIAALEDRLEADLVLGRDGEVVSELESLIVSHPLRERLRAQLMLALYRSGRQAEALEAYQQARRVLTEGLGIEPGRELRELQAAILRQDPALDAPGPAERARTPSAGGVFVGRDEELARLEAALDDAVAGRGRLVLVVGEPGIGKSRLGEELTVHARERGGRVLVGRCWEAGGAPAYWPWIQSLRSYIRDADPERLRDQLGAGAADLAQLLPELRERFPDIPEPPALESEGARFRLFEAVGSFLRNATREQPIVLVLDDLHAADDSSLLLLRFVAREIADSRLLVICAYRDVDPTLGAALRSTLAELVREPHVEQVPLAGLSRAALAEYIERSTGAEPPPGLVEAIHVETEGNPLFVAETVRLLDAEGRLAEADAHLRIPPSVRAVIRQRVARLSERCRDPLVCASVMGREFGLDALARLSGLEPGELLDVLDEAMAERVIVDVPGTPGRLRFGHALIRDTLYDELTPVRRLALHREVGEVLEAVYAADLDSHLAELAQHFIAAAPAAGAARALQYVRRAGDRAASQLAYEEAARLYEMGLALVEEPVARCDLLLARGDALARAGDTGAAKAGYRQAAELAEARGLTEHFARAALGYGGRVMWEVSRDDDELVPLLERAIDALGEEDSPLRVMLLARLAGGPLRDSSFPPERKAALSERALEIARRIGDPPTLAYAIQGYILGHHSPPHTPAQLELGRELVGLTTEIGDKERAVEAHEVCLDSYVEFGDIEAAERELEAMTRLARELRQPSQEWFALVYGSLLALLRGDLEEAERRIEGARRLGGRALAWSAEVTYRLQLYLLFREQGRLAEIADVMRASTSDYPTYPIFRAVLAQVASELGQTEEARDLLDSLARDGFAAVPFDEEWLMIMGLLAETAMALGEPGHAPALYERMLPYADRVAISYPEISTGSFARNLGLLATLMERWDEAERHFQDAVECNERMGARSWLAHTRLAYAAMRLARGSTGDPEAAGELLSSAVAAYEDLGMCSHAGVAARELERAS